SQAVLQKRQAGRGDHDRTAQGAQEAHRDHALAAAHRAPEGRAARSGEPQGRMAPAYAFLTHWRLKAAAQEVYDILADPMGLARWWPSVYLDVKELAPPDRATGKGRVIGLYTKGFLPYTLRWNFTVTEATPPAGFKLVAHGDFEGTGGVDAHAGWRARRRDLRLADPGGEATPSLRERRAAPVLRRQPSLGDGSGRGEPGPGAAPAPSQDRSRAPGDSGPARLDLQVKLPLVGVAFA